MLQALGEAASDNNTSTNVLHGQDLDDLLDVPDNDNVFAFLHDLHCLDDKILDDLLGVPDTVNALLDNGSVLSCDSADFLPYPPDMETAGALSPHMAFNAPSSDAVGCSNEKTALPQE